MYLLAHLFCELRPIRTAVRRLEIGVTTSCCYFKFKPSQCAGRDSVPSTSPSENKESDRNSKSQIPHLILMNSPIAFSFDDKDLDDAALWAVIDSAAAASLSTVAAATTPKLRTKPLTPIPFPLTSPQAQFESHTRNHRRNYNNGETVENPRPHKNLKTSTTSSPLVSESTPQKMMVVKHVYRTPTASPACNVDSPETGKFPLTNYYSPNSSAVSYEKTEVRHSLTGQFPTVSLFKEYQNAAMAVSY